MLHSIDIGKLGPLGAPMANAIQACVHCGFCLAACPTYRELGQEMDTPRGRIVLMKQVLEGTLPWEAAQPHVDRCLGCLACEPACPSGVAYRDLLSPFRALAQPHMKRSFGERLRRFLMAQTLPFPERFRIAALAARVAKVFRPLMPRALRPMLDLAPDTMPRGQTWPRVTPAHGERRARVALLIGCAQQVLDPDINTATIEVLARNGVEVVVPEAQGCCGGLAWHTGDLAVAQSFARRNLDAFPADVDAIVTNAAGCGSAMHEYHLVLRGTADEAHADAFRKRVMDVSVFLAMLGLREKFAERNLTVAYHDACHLANAQNVRREPRELLRAIPGLVIHEIPHAHLCCGSAGTYNMDQPEIAASLGEQKAQIIRAVFEFAVEAAEAARSVGMDAERRAELGIGLGTEPKMVVSGNIGCLTQLRVHLKKLGADLPVRHTMQVLRDAYRGTIQGNT